ncbi:MAG: SOS response-associated peptidase [Halanaerobiales bacterium]
MCGRYYLYIKLEKILQKYGIKDTEISFTPQKEIFPSNKTPVVLNYNKKLQLKSIKWGFSPSFTSNLIINARSETIEEKPTFRKSFYQRRCLIPATGFFEWKKEGKNKEKYKITLKNKELFSFAGIFDYFQNQNGNQFAAYSILTTSANNKIKSIHQRMPVIITGEEQEKDWLNPDIKNTGYLKKMLTPYPDKYVNLKKVEKKN